jgi:adenosylcobinamide-GDP ribazoletransferase
MVALLAAFQFLTTMPAIIRRAFTADELGRSTGFYPVVGLVLGVLLFTLDSSFRVLFSPEVSAALVLAAWLMFTRALHFDGFLDVCDGLFGGFTPERRLEIMRDSRVGAFGVAGGAALLLLKYSAIVTLSHRTAGFILAPTIARWGMVIAIVAFPYARQTGLGRHMKDRARWPQALLATMITSLVVLLFGGLGGIVIWAVAGIVLLSVAWYIMRYIPGMTGDTYGALCELLEAVVLILFTIN